MRPGTPIKGVFFDAGDTLFTAREPIGQTYSRFAARYGVTADADVLEERFRSAFKAAPPLAFPGAPPAALPALERAWWRARVASVFEDIPFPRFSPFFDALYRYFASAAAWRCYPETKAVLRRLREAGYLLGVVSNFDSRLFSICADLGIRDDFQVMRVSSREGAAKPDPGIFEQALRQAGMRPSEAIYVGDSPTSDAEGAGTVGMHPLLLDRNGALGEWKGVPRIQDLNGIFPAIEKALPPACRGKGLV